MAITTPTIIGDGQMPVSRTGPLSFNNDEDDANGTAQQCIATPGAGKAIYLTSVTYSGITADIAITLRDAATGTVLFGPIQMQADGGGLFTKDWKDPVKALKLIDNKALFVFASAASAFTIYGEYFIGESPI